MKTYKSLQTLTILSFLVVIFSSCTKMKREAYHLGLDEGYKLGKEACESEHRWKEYQEKQSNKSNYSVDDAKRDILYYFELYNPEEKVDKSSIKIRSIGTNLFNIQLRSISDDSINSRTYKEHKYILHLAYDAQKKTFNVQQINYSYEVKYKGN